MRVLQHAERCYLAMDRFRRDRERNKRYAYGDQWGDKITVDGRTMTEEEYIRQQGNIPLKNNLIRRLIRSVVGVFRQQQTEPVCIARDRDEQKLGETMSTVLQYNQQLNRMTELNARSVEEFLISGLVVHKKWYGYRDGKLDTWTDYIQPDNFFIDPTMKDFRTWDCQIVGEIHDISFEELSSRFAQTPEQYRRLTEIYAACRDARGIIDLWQDFGYGNASDIVSFLTPTNSALCRIIEVWRRETKPRYICHDLNSGDLFKLEESDYQTEVIAENARRLAMAAETGIDPEQVPLIQAKWIIDSYWYFYYITPSGEILKEGESPYAHESHPYVFRAYPFIDGEVHSFVSDIIDQQRYVNRLITQHDWIMRASAKGLLLVPEDTIPEGMSPEDFADNWSSYNGMIIYRPSRSGAVPQQIAANSTNIGINDLLGIQLKFFEEISGVNGALQGKPGYSGMSAALYNQQTQNATLTLLDILDTFSDFSREGAAKDVKNIQQFYSIRKLKEIAGKDAMGAKLNPESLKNIEFDLSIVPSTATPVYRAIINDFLMEIFRSGQIDLSTMLEVSSFPFADKLLQKIESMKAQQEQAMQQAQQQQIMAMQAQQQPQPATSAAPPQSATSTGA